MSSIFEKSQYCQGILKEIATRYRDIKNRKVSSPKELIFIKEENAKMLEQRALKLSNLLHYQEDVNPKLEELMKSLEWHRIW